MSHIKEKSPALIGDEDIEIPMQYVRSLMNHQVSIMAEVEQKSITTKGSRPYSSAT